MIFPNKFPFILLVMTTSLCCMRLLLSVHASPLGTTLKDRAQLNGGRIFLGYYYAWKETLATEIRKHDGFNVLVDHSLPISIQPSCVFEDTHPRQIRNQYALLQITVDQIKFLELDQLYSSTYLVTERERKSFIGSRGKNPEKTIIVSPNPVITKDPKFLDDLVIVFPASLLLPYAEIYHKKYLNPLQIDAQLVNSEKFVDWRDWPKRIIDLPPDLEPRPRP
ncbi:hypothetical protein LENED_003917 [Lentinula edodes]|uniref:Uncharacterized protein n=1 Tax=Lentinula edodes TaxID=5353 RepID=A0A1Q3E4V1_LENED|nr:uncharacterized protein C8R40DRAFT_1124136 [Lentinula edodes]KAH7871088.1 hypothetical protein C8R40DRAFT_1124136 [Lentinula edodes]GAW02272.1 hypothetical protein LENED_003917 [Lentinula edodes]